METNILAACIQSRAAYEDLKTVLDIKDLSLQGQTIYKYIEEFYATDRESSNVCRAILSSKIERNHPDHKKILLAFLDLLQDVSVPNVVEEYLDVKLDKLGNTLAAAVYEHRSQDDLIKMMHTYLDIHANKLAGEEDNDVYNAVSVRDLIEPFKAENLIHVEPLSLNQALAGGLVKPCHIIIFGRPNSGKSLLAVSLACSFLRQDMNVVYFGNEDSYKMMLVRMINNLSNMTKDEVIEDPDLAEERAVEMGYHNLHFIDSSGGTPESIRAKVRKYNAQVIVIDQLRNLSLGGRMGRVEQLDYITRAVRDVGKDEDCITLSITQAGDSARDKVILDMEDVDWSNTAVQAGAELMIGVGMDDAMDRADRRVLSFCKTKNPDMADILRVKVNKHLSRIEDAA